MHKQRTSNATQTYLAGCLATTGCHRVTRTTVIAINTLGIGLRRGRHVATTVRGALQAILVAVTALALCLAQMMHVAKGHQIGSPQIGHLGTGRMGHQADGYIPYHRLQRGFALIALNAVGAEGTAARQAAVGETIEVSVLTASTRLSVLLMRMLLLLLHLIRIRKELHEVGRRGTPVQIALQVQLLLIIIRAGHVAARRRIYGQSILIDLCVGKLH